MSLAGQQLFFPPNVAGWDDTRWLDTATFRARWEIAAYALEPKLVKGNDKHVPHKANELVDRAHAVLGRPTVTAQTNHILKHFATRSLADANQKWKKDAYPPLIENALRQLLASAPDLQTS
jgi:hypothetical protein